MATLIWNQACTMGVQSLDDQHGNLLDALNELRTALVHGAAIRVVRPMLARVADLLRMHVQCEDKLLAKHDYPGLAKQRAEHQQLLGRLSQYDTRFESWQTPAVYELVEYLRKWFTAHTVETQQKCGPWLRSRGVR